MQQQIGLCYRKCGTVGSSFLNTEHPSPVVFWGKERQADKQTNRQIDIQTYTHLDRQKQRTWMTSPYRTRFPHCLRCSATLSSFSASAANWNKTRFQLKQNRISPEAKQDFTWGKQDFNWYGNRISTETKHKTWFQLKQNRISTETKEDFNWKKTGF